MQADQYSIEGVPFKGAKMLIPAKLRGKVLEGLHAAHQGVGGMQANATERFFWPYLNAALRQIRSVCKQCNENAPSQPAESMILSDPPEYPFQQVVTDFADMEGHDFIIYADRFSGWLEVAKLSNKTWRSVRQVFLQWFSSFGVPEEISSDGGPPFNSSSYDDFLQRWGVWKRQSSAHYPQSNGRAEVAVKTAKRILEGNINPVTGQLDTEAAARALLTYRNTPVQDTGCSPAISLYGRPMRDHLPRKMGDVRCEWKAVADARECAHAKRQLRRDPEITNRAMDPLSVGDSVQIQNQAGNKPKRWYSTGTVVECLPYRQYQVMVDGSRRVTLRNRRFLRRIDPVCRKQISPPAYTPPMQQTEQSVSPVDVDSPESLQQPPGDVRSTTPRIPQADDHIPRRRLFPNENDVPQVDEVGDLQEDGSNGLRRGTRVRKARVRFSPKLRGQSHEEESL